MPGRNFALPLAALTLLLAAPAAASAAVYEVDQKAGDPGCADNVCRTITAALAKAGPGDTVQIRRGLYEEEGLQVTDRGLTLEAAPGAVAITSKGAPAGSDVLRVSADGVTLRGLTIGVQPQGGSAVAITGAGTVIETTTLVNQASGGADVATLEVLAPSGTTTVRNAIVLHTPDLSTVGGAPAIFGPRASTLTLEGTQAIAGPESGPAVALGGPSATIARSGLLALNANAEALRVTSAADSTIAKQVVVDSSVLAGGTNGAGLQAHSVRGNLPAGSSAGPIDLDLRHVTIAGSARSIVLNAAANATGSGATPKGSIDVLAERSIVHGPAQATNYDGEPLDPFGVASAPNTARLTIVDSDTNVQAYDESGSRIAVSGASNTPDEALFADARRRIYLLRHDAPVRDKGGPVRDGESDRDLEGEPRLEGVATDLGADEFHNKLPIARLSVPAQSVEHQPAVLDASASADPEASYGGGIREYRWDFGDGLTEVSHSPRVEHVYRAIGTYRPSVTVVDVLGGVSTAAVGTIRVTDGVPPVLRIAQPRNGQTFALRRTVRVKGRGGEVRRVKRARAFRFQGTAQDAAGIRSVELSFAYGRPRGRTCRYLDAKRGRIAGVPCSRPVFFPVRFREGIWAYRTKLNARLLRGTYLVTVRVTDRSGVQATQTLRFRLK